LFTANAQETKMKVSRFAPTFPPHNNRTFIPNNVNSINNISNIKITTDNAVAIDEKAVSETKYNNVQMSQHSYSAFNNKTFKSNRNMNEKYDHREPSSSPPFVKKSAAVDYPYHQNNEQSSNYSSQHQFASKGRGDFVSNEKQQQSFYHRDEQQPYYDDRSSSRNFQKKPFYENDASYPSKHSNYNYNNNSNNSNKTKSYNDTEKINKNFDSNNFNKTKSYNDTEKLNKNFDSYNFNKTDTEKINKNFDNNNNFNKTKSYNDTEKINKNFDNNNFRKNRTTASVEDSPIENISKRSQQEDTNTSGDVKVPKKRSRWDE
jgi:hypothetical protein